jgi:hypothetical protein
MKMPPVRIRELVVGIAAVVAVHVSPVADAQRSWENAPANLVRGAIQVPAEGDRVGRAFTVTGTAGGQVRNLWLVVKIRDLYWPKEPKLNPKDGKWRGEVNEGGNPPDGKFEVLLLDVSEKTSLMFEEWMKRGHRSGSYPGIAEAEVEGVRVLARRAYRL